MTVPMGHELKLNTEISTDIFAALLIVSNDRRDAICIPDSNISNSENIISLIPKVRVIVHVERKSNSRVVAHINHILAISAGINVCGS